MVLLLIMTVFLQRIAGDVLTIELFMEGLTAEYFYPDIQRKFDQVYTTNSRETNNVYVSFSTLQNRVYEKYVRESHFTRVLEVSAGDDRMFDLATHVISGMSRVPRNTDGNGINIPRGNASAKGWKLDLDVERFPFEDNHFDFVYCNRVLQDLSNPEHAFGELTRVARNGYIESPSPLMSTLLWDEYQSIGFRGHPRHRFLVWTNLTTNVLHVMPKFPLMDQILPSLYGSWELEAVAKAVAEQVQSLGSDFYSWHDFADPPYMATDERTNRTVLIELSRRKQPIKVIKHDIDYDFQSLAANGGYPSEIRRGIRQSIENAVLYLEQFLQPMLNLKLVHHPV
jgi:hypothetical protein